MLIFTVHGESGICEMMRGVSPHGIHRVSRFLSSKLKVVTFPRKLKVDSRPSILHYFKN